MRSYFWAMDGKSNRKEQGSRQEVLSEKGGNLGSDLTCFRGDNQWRQKASEEQWVQGE